MFGDGSDPDRAWSIAVHAGEVSRDGVRRFRFEGLRRFASFRDVDTFRGTPVDFGQGSAALVVDGFEQIAACR